MALIVAARSIRLVVAFVSHSEMTESTELKKAAEANLLDAQQPPFFVPPPSQGNHPGNEVATTTHSAIIAQEEDEDVRDMDGTPTRKSTRSGKQVKDNNFVHVFVNIFMSWSKTF